MDKLENAFEEMKLFEGEEAEKRTQKRPAHRPPKKEEDKLQNKVGVSLTNELYALLEAEANKDYIPCSIKARAIIADYFRKKGLYK